MWETPVILTILYRSRLNKVRLEKLRWWRDFGHWRWSGKADIVFANGFLLVLNTCWCRVSRRLKVNNIFWSLDKEMDLHVASTEMTPPFNFLFRFFGVISWNFSSISQVVHKLFKYRCVDLMADRRGPLTDATKKKLALDIKQWQLSDSSISLNSAIKS